MAIDAGSAVGYLDLDISGFLANLKSAQTEADLASKNIVTKIGTNLKSAGTKLTSAGSTLTKTVTAPLLGVGVAGLKVATDFEKGMSQVQAISGSTGKQLNSLKEKAIELGADTAFSANEVAEAMTEMAKAGWGSEQIIAGMSGVLAAAAASGEGLASVSTIVADAITGFGMEAQESTRIADLLTQAANSGTIGISDLGESFKYIAPVAGAMGLSVEDVTTAISAMSMAGIKGSQAGTSLRTTLTNMVKPTDAMAAAMDKLGISATNSDGTMKSLDGIVANLRDSFSGLTEAEKAKYAATIAGKQGMSGMLALLNLTEEEYNAIAESMDNASGVAEKTASVMQDNLSSKIEQLGGALESLAIKLADYIIPYIRQFVEWLTALIDKFTALDAGTQKTILKFVGFAAAIGPILAIFGKLTSGIGSTITAFGKFPSVINTVTTKIKHVGEAYNLAKAGMTGFASQTSKLGTALAGITGPMIAIVAVIALVIAAFVSLWKNNEEFRNKVIEIWNGLKEKFQSFAQGIVDRLNALGFSFESITEVISTVWNEFCELLAPVFEGAFSIISSILGTVFDIITGMLDVFIGLFTGNWEQFWNGIKEYFSAIWDGIKGIFESVINIIKGIFDTILSWFGTSWDECWTKVKDTFVNIWNNITSFLSTAWDTIKNAVQVGIMFIVELFKAAFNLITLPFRFIWENCKDIIIPIWESIKEIISGALTAIKEKITTIWNNVKTFFTTVWNAISLIVSSVWDSISSKISSVINTIKDFISSVFNSIKSTVSSIWNGIKEAITGPMNSAKSSITSIFDSIKEKISTTLTNVKKTVTDIIESIKSKFNFSWSLPKLKMPHFKIDGEFSLSPPSVPKFSIDWYNKAMNKGMILNTATIFGFDSSTGKFLAGGESGSETIVGTNSLMKMIKLAVEESTLKMLKTLSEYFDIIFENIKYINESLAYNIGRLIDISYELVESCDDLGYIAYEEFTKHKQRHNKLVDSKNNNNTTGDTFIFNSPKPIDEIEAAKQMKRTKRDLAEGF